MIDKIHGHHRSLLLHVLIGAILGVIVLHPLTTLVFWFEFSEPLNLPGSGAWNFLIDRLITSYKVELMPMSLVFAVIGGALGLAFGLYHIKLLGQQRLVHSLDHELAEELPLLIARGEGENMEFKTSLRWDVRQQRADRPVYFLDGQVSRFMLRAGNSTRELDVREAQAHLSQREADSV